MKTVLFLLATLTLAQSAFAEKLEIACSKDSLTSYKALTENNLSTAKVHAMMTLLGKKFAPETFSITTPGGTWTDANTKLSDWSYSDGGFTFVVHNRPRFIEIDVMDCEDSDLSLSSGSAVLQTSTPSGFTGSRVDARYECVCRITK